ncbi:MAG: hydantoinase/oxoprolinase family protein [Candidatus Thermoplasmatota archaeon]
MSISIDIGGTFTDFVVIEDKIKYFKMPSTPEQPEKAITKALERENIEVDENVFHGTTVATNAFIEGKGVESAFLTNEGFEDILFIGRQTRPDLYDLETQKPKPPLKKENTFGLSCRTGPKGQLIEEVKREEVERIAEELSEKDLSAAVCLLHSYKDPEQEKKIGEVLEEYDLNYSLSHLVTGEFREYERGLTTLLDSYLGPLVEDYFASLTDIFGKEPYIMKSGGGLEKSSKVDAVDCLYSGPAGGVAGGAFIAQELDMPNIVTFDMGGTSADMATVIDKEISWKDHGEIEGFPIQSKMVNIVTVGSGGGSIARCDEGGALRVGPESAGARPGPVCYGRGGKRPTVTDALLLMGYIDPDYFLGGEMKLGHDRAKRSIKELSEQLQMDYEETLRGIFRVANSKMARTMKKITVERGVDPEDFAILAFGGAGPLHAASIAEELGMERVLIPPMAGVFSALGMLTGDIVHDYSKTLLTSLDDQKKLDKTIKEMRAEIEEKGEERILLGLRYKGQSYHMNIPYIGPEDDISARFHEEHERKYGYANQEEEIEIVRVHIEIVKEREIEELPFSSNSGDHPENRKCLFSEGWEETSIFLRKYLSKGQEGKGPSVIEGVNSTILVPPDWRWTNRDSGVIDMEVKR